MDKFLAWLKARAAEKSTWVGILSAIVAITGHAVTPDIAPQIDGAAVLITSLVLACTKTQGSVNAHPAVVVLALLLLTPLGACMWTDSQGNQVVLTVQNAAPLVVDKIKQLCASYDANKVTDDALLAVATQAINNSTATSAAKTVQQIATDACPLIEALIQTKAAPTPAAATPSSG